LVLSLLVGAAPLPAAAPKDEHACCGQTEKKPAQSKTPCAAMICCRVAPAPASTVLSAPQLDLIAVLPAFSLAVPPAAFAAAAAAPSCGPPGRLLDASSGRSPPSFLA
jgi:hypothetical protein